MKNIYTICVLLLLSTTLCSYKTYFHFGRYASEVKQIKQTNYEWCFYASVEMASSLPQCHCAERYRRWKGTITGELPDPTFECCSPATGYFCGGVAFDRLPQFHSQVLNPKTRLTLISWEINDRSDKIHTEIPRIGILDLRDSHGTYHAIYVYRVEITISKISSMGGIVDYEVFFIDPWTGKPNSQKNTSYSGDAFSSVYVLK